MPRVLKLALWVLVPASLVPFLVVANQRSEPTEKPRLRLFQGMAQQARLSPQGTSPHFDDRRAMRMPVPGTVARGRLPSSDHFSLGLEPGKTTVDPETGKPTPVYYEGFPGEVDVTAELLARGRERYDIYCAPCHAQSGDGKGMVHQRAVELETPTWIQPSNLHSDEVRAMPAGRIFATITSGARSMPGYAAQIEPMDRWAIVAYLEALQLSQRAPLEEVREKP